MEACTFIGRLVRPAALMAASVAFAALLMVASMAPGAAGDESKPYFLVATADLGDPIFERSVILMLPPAPPPNEIIAGLIINKPTTIPLQRLFPKAAALKDGTAYFGGPVELNEASLLIRTPVPPGKATRLLGDVYLSTDPGSITSAMGGARTPNGVRFLLGRAQWSRDQLHHEIMEGAWYIAPAEAEMVFSADPKTVWRALVRRAQLLKVDAVAPEGRGAPDLLWAPRQPPD